MDAPEEVSQHRQQVAIEDWRCKDERLGESSCCIAHHRNHNARHQYQEPEEHLLLTYRFEDYIKEMSEFNRPVNPPVIKTITVETFGKTYNSPTKLEAK